MGIKGNIYSKWAAHEPAKNRQKSDVVSREYTINLHKRLHKCTFKDRAPRAIREIKRFAIAKLGTKDVRIDTTVNRYVWSKGIRNVPKRIRVQCSRKQTDDDEAEEELYTVVTLKEVPTFKGLLNETVAE